MRLFGVSGAVGEKSREFGLRSRTALVVLGGTLAVAPTFALTGGTESWVKVANQLAPPPGGGDPGSAVVGVDGSLPQPPDPEALLADVPPPGPLGIPGGALRAYQNAANILGSEQPACHIDWALIASIGRIESNHARGGYLDAKGNTLEPILGPVLDGVGPVAAIRDTDGGRYDGDTVWDRAVGPTQFIPSTWQGYASDGNADGETNPNNIYDATLGSGRYLCSGGLDLANPEQLRTAVFRYNNSDSYVTTVLTWAQAYRTGVTPLPDSDVPVGPANPVTEPAPAPVTPPPAPVDPGTPSNPPGPGEPGPSLPPSQSEPPPTCESVPPSSSTPPSSTTPPPSSSLPPCEPSTPPSSEPDADSGSPAP
ncbi:lytic transglycosylase domain-containing protein [Amycolatopsis magusensis]|uniref:lytic transglycosylase domain-containing protein n=1 Tax=Amycolatopsis magusensis TaxID=882444 RepID=UPI0037B43F26